MLKFFRRYNKAILMVGGSILMVLFLLPTTATQVGRGTFSATAAYLDGKRIKVADFVEAKEDLDLLEKLVPELLAALRIETNRPDHWVLLVHEAMQAGLVAGPRDAREGLPPELADALRVAGGRGAGHESPGERAVARMKGVMRLVDSYNAASLYSAQEALRIGKSMFDTATVGVVTVSAETLSADLPVPDEERLLAHFEKYRDVEPASDPHRIGYRRPSAVRIEWFSLNRRSIEAACTPDPVEVNTHWRRNQAKFPGEFSAVRAQVEQDLRRQQVDQVMARAADVIRRELFRSTAGLPSDGNYKVLPDDWASRMPAIGSLAQQAEDEIRKQLPSVGVATTVAADDGVWRSSADLARLPGIGATFIRFGAGNFLPFGQYLMMARELGGLALVGVQAGMVHGPLEDAFGSHYYVRILDARRASPTPSLDDVRDAAVRDLKMLDALERLGGEADVYRVRAVADGLQKLGESVNVPVRWTVQVTEREVRGSQGGAIDPYLDSPVLREPVMSAARRMDPLAPPEATDADARTVAVVVPPARGLVIAQVQRFRPMTVEKYRQNLKEIHAAAARELGGQRAIDSLSFKNLVARHAYKPVKERAEEWVEAPNGEDDGSGG